MEEHYELLIQTLYNDLVNSKLDGISEKLLVNYLFQINQPDKAQEGFFALISACNKAQIKKEIGEGNLLSFDTYIFSKLALQILEASLNSQKTFKDFYSVSNIKFILR